MVNYIDNLNRKTFDILIKKYNEQKNAELNTNDIFSYNLIIPKTYSFITMPKKNNNKDRYIMIYFYNFNDNESCELIRKYGRQINNLCDESLTLITMYDYHTFKSWGEENLIGYERLRTQFTVNQPDIKSNEFKELALNLGLNPMDFPIVCAYDIETKALFYKSLKDCSVIDKYNEILGIIVSFKTSTNPVTELNNKYSSLVLEKSINKYIKEDFYELYDEFTYKSRGSKAKISTELGYIDYESLRKRIDRDRGFCNSFSRDEIIVMIFVLNLNMNDANRFLKAYGVGILNKNEYRDSIICRYIDNESYDIESLSNDLKKIGSALNIKNLKEKE